MKNISFALTERQFVDRTKSVTRRLGWVTLKAGDRLMGCRKCMGRKPGEPLVRLGEIEVVSVRREPLEKMLLFPEWGAAECVREGFPEMEPAAFVDFFCHSHQARTKAHPKGCTRTTLVTRIEFKHV